MEALHQQPNETTGANHESSYKSAIQDWRSQNDLDYHLMRISMVIIFAFFGYQKWFEYEAEALIPYISHGPLIFWMYPVFGVHGATYFLGVSEWLFGALLFAGFWNKKLGILGPQVEQVVPRAAVSQGIWTVGDRALWPLAGA